MRKGIDFMEKTFFKVFPLEVSHSDNRCFNYFQDDQKKNKCRVYSHFFPG